MPKKDTDNNPYISETGNWNVASEYSRIKIMQPLANCDVYADIARYGHSDFMEELANFNIPSNVVRIKSLYRLINELIKLCDNTAFAMKKGKTKEELKKLKSRLVQLDKLVGQCGSSEKNDEKDISYIVINEHKFEILLEAVIKVKSEINVPLNKNDLIYVNKEEFDPYALKDKLKERMINRG